MVKLNNFKQTQQVHHHRGFSQHIFGIIIETAPRTIIGGNFVRQLVYCRDFFKPTTVHEQ